MKQIVEFAKAVALFSAVAATSAALIMKVAMYTGGEEIQTPQVTGAALLNAMEIADRGGLNLKVARMEYHPSIGKDKVISQTPAAGEPVKRGRDVRVTLSKGAKTNSAPKLTGVTRRGLENLLVQHGLRVKNFIYVHMSGVEKGVILAQRPPAGAPIGKGEEVTVVESLGPPVQYVPVPDLTDKPVDVAMKTLAGMDLKAGEVSYRAQEGKAKGVAISQDPPPGRRVERGTAVALVASEGVAIGGGGAASYTLFFYTIPPGPEPVKVSIVQANSGGEKEVYNRVHSPGETVSMLLEVRGKTAAKVFLDGKLADVKRF